VLGPVAADRHGLLGNQRLDGHGGGDLQASVADVKDARDGVPGLDFANKDEADRIVGHLVALAQDPAPKRGARASGGRRRPLPPHASAGY
jgi:hypothetical protein